MMKKTPLLTVLALISIMTANATPVQNPKGLYRLKQFIYENGSTRPPGFSQYKYAADSVGLLVSFRPSMRADKWSSMTVEIRETYPLTYTGEKPQGADGHGTQIFNVDDDQFLFKWYNDKFPNMSNLNEFITEVYRKSAMEPDVVKAFKLFEDKTDHTAGKFYGWWVRTGAAANADGTGQRTSVPVMWKAYGPELSMVVNILNNGNVLGCNTTGTVRYDNDSTIYEIGHRCHIKWLSDNCHTLTFVQENGVKLTEIWERGGLPREWQNVFNTNLATYRNAVDCIRDAVVQATQKGDLKQTDRFIAEAIGKNVSIEVLSQGVMGIALDLLVNKEQYQDCVTFSTRHLQTIRDYAADGHEQTIASNVSIHLTEIFKSIATYRCGDKENGQKLMDERQSIIDSEIERYKAVKGMEPYCNLLYYCNMLLYYYGYDIYGAEKTLLYMDALSLMAPAMTSSLANQLMILNCRANCYLLQNDEASAQKLWLQIKERDDNYFKKQPASNPLKKTFGD